MCRYEAQCFGVKVDSGKLQSRQLTEEEKKALEEAQTKGNVARMRIGREESAAEADIEEGSAGGAHAGGEGAGGGGAQG